MRSGQALCSEPRLDVGRNRAPQEAFCGDEASICLWRSKTSASPQGDANVHRQTNFGSPWKQRAGSLLTATDSGLAQDLEAAPTPPPPPSDLQPRGSEGGRRETARRDAGAVMRLSPAQRGTLRRARAEEHLKRSRSGKRRHCSIWCCNQMVGGFPRGWRAEKARQRTS